MCYRERIESLNAESDNPQHADAWMNAALGQETAAHGMLSQLAYLADEATDAGGYDAGFSIEEQRRWNDICDSLGAFWKCKPDTLGRFDLNTFLESLEILKQAGEGRVVRC